MDELKILVAGDPASIHTARFVTLLQILGYNTRVFQSEHYYYQDEHLKNTVIYVSKFESWPVNGNILRVSVPFEVSFSFSIFGRIGRRIERHFRRKPRSYALAKTMLRWKPDIVFSLKMQNDGYTVDEAKKLLGKDFKPKWIHFNWGTDIEFFGKHPDYIEEHLPKIKHLLASCDFHVADCYRDVHQAVEYGFSGQSLGMCLANGGYHLDSVSQIRENARSDRSIILVKGRQGGLVGKAFNVLRALHRIPHISKHYKIKIIMTDQETKGAAKLLSEIDGIEYEVLPRLPYKELLGLFARSKIAISASDVDGTPSFLTEAMVMGALPIHSDMDSVREWITDGVNGLLFPVDDIDALTSCIERAHLDNQLVETARVINWEIANDRMDRNKIRDQVRNLVERVCENGQSE